MFFPEQSKYEPYEDYQHIKNQKNQNNVAVEIYGLNRIILNSLPIPNSLFFL